MSAAPGQALAAHEVRWYHWQVRYDRAMRRQDFQAGVVAVVIFAAIAVGLLVQLLGAWRIA